MQRHELEALACGSLSGERAQRHRHHLEACTDCRKAMAEIEAEQRLFGELRQVVCEEENMSVAGRTRFQGVSACNGSSRNGFIDSIEGYDLDRELHRGGQGVIYKATQHVPRRTVALKVLLAGSFASPRERFRFDREVELIASLRHPNIVTVFESGTAGSRPYFTMEFVQGRRLDQYLADRDLPLHDRLRLFQKICWAMHYAHQHGVMHRDLKPGNILVDETGEPRVLDFGLARADSDETTTLQRVTVTGEFMGTLAYASPEQVTGDPRQVDIRTDVYSLGVVLYEMLSARLPYETTDQLSEMLRRISQDEPASLTGGERPIDDELETIVMKALAKDKERRYQSTEALALDIEHYVKGEPIEARRDSTWYVLRKALCRHKLSVAAAVFMVLVVVVFSATMTVMYGKAEREATRAKQTQVFLERLLASASSYDLGPDVKLLEVLQSAEQRIHDELAAQPEVEASVRLTIGRTYASIRFFAQAEQHVRAALKISREVYAKDDPRVVASVALLGVVLAEQNKPASIRLQREALDTRLRLYGADDPLTAESTMDLAFALGKCGPDEDIAKAQALFDRAIERYRDLGPSHRRGLARCLHKLANLHLQQDHYDQAEPVLEEALAIYRQLDDEDDPYAVELINDYATFLAWTGEYEQADELLRESLVITPQAFGQVMMPYLSWELGKVRHAQHKYAAAEAMYRKSLVKSCVRIAEKLPHISESVLSAASPLFREEDGEVDASVYLAIFRSMRGVKQVPQLQLAQGLFDLGVLRLDQGDASGAAALLRESLDIRSDHLAADHVLMAEANSALGGCLTKLGEFAQAEPLLVASYQRLRAVHGEASVPADTARARLLDLYEQWGPADKAGALKLHNSRAGAGTGSGIGDVDLPAKTGASSS